MGLDWLPLGKPKPGHEAEFLNLFEELLLFQKKDAAMQTRWEEIQISPYETLGVPRVGFDPEADRWAAEQYPKRPWKKLFVSRRKFMRVLHGYYVEDLVPPIDGLPHYSNGGVGSYCDVLSFRGKFLEYCEDALDEELIGEAWTSHNAADLMDYGARLRDRAVAYAEKEKVSNVLPFRDSPDTEELEDPASQAHIVISAARWCAFWGERGHGMIADF